MPRTCSRLLPSQYIANSTTAAEARIRQLLPVVGDHGSAVNELRWLEEHARLQARRRGRGVSRRREDLLLQEFCDERAKGKPLQYLLGTEYFGDLEIRCRPGVLIPRWETASLTTSLATRLVYHRQQQRQQQSGPRGLKILDLCTGTGCISFLLQHLLSAANHRDRHHQPIHIHTLGLDTSRSALVLAEENRRHLLRSTALKPDPGSSITFARADVLNPVRHPGSTVGREQDRPPPLGWAELLRIYKRFHLRPGTSSASSRGGGGSSWDVLVANPPYISPTDYESKTEPSVRSYEPVSALVPPPPPPPPPLSAVATPPSSDPSPAATATTEPPHAADTFYPALLDVAISTGAKVVLFEVGDEAQAGRVAGLVARRMRSRMTAGEEGRSGWDRPVVRIWRDEPDGRTELDEEDLGAPLQVGARLVDDEHGGWRVVGRGKVRGVFAFDAGQGGLLQASAG